MDILLFLLFFVVIPTIIIKIAKPKFVDFELFFILLKFKKGKSIFDKLAKLCPKFWHFIGEFGIVLGFGLLGSLYLLKNKISLKKCIMYQALHTVISLFLVMFIVHALSIHLFVISSLFGTSFLMVCLIFEKAISIVLSYINGAEYISPGVAPVLPKALGIKLKNVPSYIQLPLYALISLALIIIIHEGFHGVLCRLEKIKLKTYGLLFLGVIPIGAFVEPDEEDLIKKKSIQRNKMFAAGSMGNFVLFIITFILYLALQAYISYSHINIHTFYNVTQVYKNYSGITPGTYIYNIYNQDNDLYLNTSKGIITLNNTNINELFSYIDANVVVKPKDKYWLFVILDILKYTWLLSLMVGLINYLPLLIFDGARMFNEICITLFKNEKIVFVLNVFILILFLINALPMIF